MHSQNRHFGGHSRLVFSERRFCIRKIARIFASRKLTKSCTSCTISSIFASRKFVILRSIQRPKSSILAVFDRFRLVVEIGQNRRFWPLYRSTFAQNFVPKFCAKVCTGHGHFSFWPEFPGGEFRLNFEILVAIAGRFWSSDGRAPACHQNFARLAPRSGTLGHGSLRSPLVVASLRSAPPRPSLSSSALRASSSTLARRLAFAKF